MEEIALIIINIIKPISYLDSLTPKTYMNAKEVQLYINETKIWTFFNGGHLGRQLEYFERDATIILPLTSSGFSIFWNTGVPSLMFFLFKSQFSQISNINSPLSLNFKYFIYTSTFYWNKNNYFLAGQAIDGPRDGQAPGPWDIGIAPPKLFETGSTFLEVPHTAAVKVNI